jgi:hypothetical protein
MTRSVGSSRRRVRCTDFGMYSENAAGGSDNEIAGLFRHAADELDEAAMREDRKIIPAV